MFAIYGSSESATSRWWEPRRNAHAALLGTQRRIYGLKYILAVLSIVATTPSGNQHQCDIPHLCIFNIFNAISLPNC
uniref:Uncharacterized protein n=1 Tax=Trichogramma kaykai TaxID=54128 RepID=A0ABD2W6E0_9HYME